MNRVVIFCTINFLMILNGTAFSQSLLDTISSSSKQMLNSIFMCNYNSQDDFQINLIKPANGPDCIGEACEDGYLEVETTTEGTTFTDDSPDGIIGLTYRVYYGTCSNEIHYTLNPGKSLLVRNIICLPYKAVFLN
jgi:hypothetical protein